MKAQDITGLTQDQVQEKWKTQDFHIYKPKSHVAVEAEWMYGDSTDPEQLMIEQEEQEEVTNKRGLLLSILTPRQKQIIEGLYFEGKTQTQIAEELGISQPTVSEHVSVAFERMQKHSLSINDL